MAPHLVTEVLVLERVISRVWWATSLPLSSHVAHTYFWCHSRCPKVRMRITLQCWRIMGNRRCWGMEFCISSPPLKTNHRSRPGPRRLPSKTLWLPNIRIATPSSIKTFSGTYIVGWELDWTIHLTFSACSFLCSCGSEEALSIAKRKALVIYSRKCDLSLNGGKEISKINFLSYFSSLSI